MCRCRDTGSKRCRWEHPSDTHSANMKALVRLDRKATNQSLRRYLEEV